MSEPLTLYLSADASAQSVGMGDVLDALLAERDARGLDFSIELTSGRGLSYLEPMMEVGTERLAFGPLGVHDIGEILEMGWDRARDHKTCLGPIEDLDYLKKQTRLVFKDLGKSGWTDLKAMQEGGKFGGWDRASGLTPEEIWQEVEASGLRGRGGAGFPAHIKMRTVATTKADEKFVVCNADEGDAGTFSDRLLMEGLPFLLLEGMSIAARAVGATRGYIYLRSEYPEAARVLGEALTDPQIGEFFETVAPGFDIELRIGAGSYVCGEETALLESIEGKRGEVRSKPPLPAHEGLFGKPTLVNNVITLASLPYILEHGGAKFSAHGHERSKGTLPVQLSGNVKRGGLVEVPFGISLRELVYDFGGGTLSGRPVKAIQIGGPLGGYLPESALDLPLDIEAIGLAGASVGHGGIIVFDDTMDMSKLARFAFEFCAKESCGKCTPCRIGSVRGVELMDRVIAGEDKARNIDVMRDLCDTLTEGSLCAMGGLTPQPVLSALKHFPEDF